MQDKTLKVWDVRNWRCLQTLADRELYSPDDVISGLTMNPEQGQVVTGNLRLKVWPLVDEGASGGLCHRAPVARVLCNSVFNDAASGDRSGSVCLWNISTGALRFRCASFMLSRFTLCSCSSMTLTIVCHKDCYFIWCCTVHCVVKAQLLVGLQV